MQHRRAELRIGRVSPQECAQAFADFVLRFRESYVAAQATDDAHSGKVIHGAAVGAERKPEIGGGLETRSGRENAGHLIGRVVQYEDAADNRGIGAEETPPRAGAQDRNLGTLRTVFERREGAAQREPGAEQGEVLRGYARGFERYGSLVLREGDFRRVDVRGRQRFERRRGVAPEEKLGDGRELLFADVGCGDQLYQAIGVGIGQRLQEHLIDYGEQRGNRGDAERESGQRGDRESRIAPQGAGRAGEDHRGYWTAMRSYCR